jgi:ubiquinone/menaquinone biosynthesis C-methylase UbiE
VKKHTKQFALTSQSLFEVMDSCLRGNDTRQEIFLELETIPMKNGSHKKVIESFNTIALLPEKWDHNKQYHNYLLKHIFHKKGVGLDIGCGTGEFTVKLAKYCTKVIGIDIAPNMIQEARKRHYDQNIEYLVEQAESYLPAHKHTYSTIVCIATLHHLDAAELLRTAYNALIEGGKLLILDILKESSIVDYVFSSVSVVLHPLMNQRFNHGEKETHDEKEAWQEHAQYDEYYVINDIHRLAKEVFNTCQVRRHLFWRYSIICEKSCG